MEYILKSVALHITNECSGHCPMCYYTQEGQIKCEGNLEVLKKLGIESSMVDAFPLCILPSEYHQYLDKCDWGYGTCSMNMFGDISRCAVAEPHGENLLGNVFESPLKELWQNAPALIKFRNKEYLRLECQSCDKLTICGGGCAISCGDNQLSNDILVRNLKR